MFRCRYINRKQVQTFLSFSDWALLSQQITNSEFTWICYWKCVITRTGNAKSAQALNCIIHIKIMSCKCSRFYTTGQLMTSIWVKIASANTKSIPHREAIESLLTLSTLNLKAPQWYWVAYVPPLKAMIGSARVMTTNAREIFDVAVTIWCYSCWLSRTEW